METRARHLLVGLFALAAVVGGLWFAYWLNNAGGLAARTTYGVRFEGAVSGLRPGSAVLFNGVRVGEITKLQLVPDEPGWVTAAIAVQAGTPIRADTAVGVETQGLMGAPTVSLRGGRRDATPLGPGEGVVLVADAAASEDLTQSAREALRQIRRVVSENAEPLRGTIGNLNTFTGALARNSDRLDAIVAGLERMTAGGTGAKALPVYDLALPRELPPLPEAPAGRIVVQEPSALVVYDTQRILLRRAGGETVPLDRGQWSDSLPKLVQAKVIQALEASGYQDAVSRPADAAPTDFQLALEIRAFQVVDRGSPEAEVALMARLIGDGGRVLGSRAIRATAPAASLEASSAAAGLSAAFGQAAAELLGWTNRTLRN